MRNWEKNVKKHLEECRVRGLVKSTLQRKAGQLLGWGVWLRMQDPVPSLEEVGGNAEYSIQYIINRTQFKSKSLTYSLISNMRCLGRHLVREGVWSENPVRWLKAPKVIPYSKNPRRIQKEKIEKLFEAAGSIRGSYDRTLMLSILSTVYSTGMRRGELERLRVKDWDREEGLLKVDGQKTGRERQVPVHEIAYRSIESYLPLRQNKLLETGEESDRLLINRDGKPLSGQCISRRVYSLCRRAGVGKVTMHQFRHSCASDLLEEGVGILEVKNILGHASVGTTFRYTRGADPDRKKAMSLHPINKMIKTISEKGEEHGAAGI